MVWVSSSSRAHNNNSPKTILIPLRRESSSPRSCSNKNILNYVGEQMGFRSWDDWHRACSDDFRKHGARKILEKYGDSPLKTLQFVFPEHKWNFWNFEHISKGGWKNRNSQREFLGWLAKEVGFETMEDWYKITGEDIIELGGGGLLKRFSNSPLKLLQSVYFEHEWLPWKFHQVSKGFWEDKDNRTFFLRWLTNELSIRSLSDWHSISYLEIKKIIPTYLSKVSLGKILMETYPNHIWNLTWLNVSSEGIKRTNPARDKQILNFRTWLDGFGNELGITKMEDWYLATLPKSNAILDEYFDGSLVKALTSVYFEYEWLLWRFTERAPSGYWDAMKHQIMFFEWLSKVLDYKKLDDFYMLTNHVIIKHGGSGLLAKYGKSVSKALNSIYPNHCWVPWKFNQVRKGFWDSQDNRVKFAQSLGQNLRISHFDDWYRVSLRQIAQIVSMTLFRKVKLGHLLVTAYPSHFWDLDKFKPTVARKASLRILRTIVQDIFPNLQVIEGHDVSLYSDRKMQLDLFVPHLFLAFEYHGEQHFSNLYNLAPDWLYQERDEEKRLLCNRQHITLIEVPYWWDFAKESLLATILKFRQDLVPSLSLSNSNSLEISGNS